jgi:hypothetical protein
MSLTERPAEGKKMTTYRSTIDQDELGNFTAAPEVLWDESWEDGERLWRSDGRAGVARSDVDDVDDGVEYVVLDADGRPVEGLEFYDLDDATMAADRFAMEEA